MTDLGVMVSVRSSVRDRARFGVRSYPDAGGGPFVVLQLGSDDVSMHVWNLETLTALAGMVAEARDLLSAALVGQEPLPVEPMAVPA